MSVNSNPSIGIKQWTEADASGLSNMMRPRITVSDVERLAKAGVTIPWLEVRDQILPDPPRMAPESLMPKPLADFIWDRWRRNFRHLDAHNQYGGFTAPFQLFAAEHGDKVYVFVAPNDRPPMIIEDERCIFPSDALLAKLALLEKITP